VYTEYFLLSVCSVTEIDNALLLTQQPRAYRF
jgi:hypothetical protein